MHGRPVICGTLENIVVSWMLLKSEETGLVK